MPLISHHPTKTISQVHNDATRALAGSKNRSAKTETAKPVAGKSPNIFLKRSSAGRPAPSPKIGAKGLTTY